ncbi:hypothetical protein G9A89_004090 [Geosiphon pyriformis]|nr:hypothetical protein G9A89_004090 [Geosiphon pyriformis]
MALINKATQEDFCQIKKAEYIEYTIELTRFNYKDEVEIKDDQEKIEFGKPEPEKEIATIPIYLTEKQPVLQLKYFNNNGQEIKPKKTHDIDAEYDL